MQRNEQPPSWATVAKQRESKKHNNNKTTPSQVAEPKQSTPAAQATQSPTSTWAQVTRSGSSVKNDPLENLTNNEQNFINEDRLANPEDNTGNKQQEELLAEAEQFRQKKLEEQKRNEEIQAARITAEFEEEEEQEKQKEKQNKTRLADFFKTDAEIVEENLENPIEDLEVAAIVQYEQAQSPIPTPPTPPEEVESKTELSSVDEFLAHAKCETRDFKNTSAILTKLLQEAADTHLLVNSSNAETIYSFLIDSAIHDFQDGAMAITLSNMAVNNKALSSSAYQMMITLLGHNNEPMGITHYFKHIVTHGIINDEIVLSTMKAYLNCNPSTQVEANKLFDNVWVLYADHLSSEHKYTSTESHQLIMKMVYNNNDIKQAYLMSYAICAYDNLVQLRLANDNTVAHMLKIAHKYEYVHEKFLQDIYPQNIRGAQTPDSLEAYSKCLTLRAEQLQNPNELNTLNIQQVHNRRQHTEQRERVYTSWRPDALLISTKTTKEIIAEQRAALHQIHTEFAPTPISQQAAPVAQQPTPYGHYQGQPLSVVVNRHSTFQPVSQHRAGTQQGPSYPIGYSSPTQPRRW